MQKRLEDLIKVFLADKVFVGCAGQEINDEIRVTIVAQACLLIINRTNNYYQKHTRYWLIPLLLSSSVNCVMNRV
jgi:Mlc titration factor MtfA (ptsG expression regulator)|tara:strand:+ start:514 stop:738 length:225 start_codon:yes stop_codon:yes gene_type:complete